MVVAPHRYRPLQNEELNQYKKRYIECFCKQCRFNENGKCNNDNISDIVVSIDGNGLCATRELKG